MKASVKAVLFDRDGTLVLDVPYNGDPKLVQAVGGAKASLERLRRAGIRLAVVTNQSGIGRGMISPEQVQSVNRRVEELLGPFDGWFICPHAPEQACSCRKPSPQLALEAAQRLGVEPSACVVVGDKECDVEMARRAGMRGYLIGAQRSLVDVIEAIRPSST